MLGFRSFFVWIVSEMFVGFLRLINFHDVEHDDFVGVGGNVVNPRAGWNMEEVARMVAAYRFPQTTLTYSSHIFLLY